MYPESSMQLVSHRRHMHDPLCVAKIRTMAIEFAIVGSLFCFTKLGAARHEEAWIVRQRFFQLHAKRRGLQADCESTQSCAAHACGDTNRIITNCTRFRIEISIFLCLDPVGTRITARTRYRSKAVIKGFSDMSVDFVHPWLMARESMENNT